MKETNKKQEDRYLFMVKKHDSTYDTVYRGEMNFSPYLVKELDVENDRIKLLDTIYGTNDAEKWFSMLDEKIRFFTKEEEAIVYFKELYPVEEHFVDYFKDIMKQGDKINAESKEKKVLAHPVFKRYPSMSFISVELTPYNPTGKEPPYRDVCVYMDEEYPQMLGYIRIKKGGSEILRMSEKPMRMVDAYHIPPSVQISNLKKEAVRSVMNFVSSILKKDVSIVQDEKVIVEPDKETIEEYVNKNQEIGGLSSKTKIKSLLEEEGPFTGDPSIKQGK